MTTAERPFAIVRTRDQWRRMAHTDTFIDGETGGIELRWVRPLARHTPAPLTPPAGMAFDAECRLYRSLPDQGRVVRMHWTDAVANPAPDAPDIVDPGREPIVGDFTSPGGGVSSLQRPVGLALDVDDRLYVADATGGAVLVFDLWSGRLLRRARTGTAAAPRRRPLDLACYQRTVWAVTADPPGLVQMAARTGPTDGKMPHLKAVPSDAAPKRVAVDGSGNLFVLLDRADGSAWVVSAAQAQAQEVDGATDIAFDGQGNLVVACLPGEPFRVFTLSTDGWTEIGPLEATGYDGSGIVLTPSGRIGFWSAVGLRMAMTARREYSRSGRVTTYRLDSGAYQTQWGRLFIDACIPSTTDVRVHCATSDEDDESATLPRVPPDNLTAEVSRPDLSPPMPPVTLIPTADEELVHQLYRRQNGREIPWARLDADDPFETFEAPIVAPPGRYLWVTLELLGDTRHSPRVRCLRAEHPGHDTLRRLPRAYSRDASMFSFLYRYLSPIEGTLNDLDVKSEIRNALIDPGGAPEEILPWLASFLGLLLDLRWPVAARRQLVREVTWLFRFRGTLAGLRRFIEIYLGIPCPCAPPAVGAFFTPQLASGVTILEKFRLRGLGGALLGSSTGGAFTTSVLGAGFRVGGAIDSQASTPLQGTFDDAFNSHAHRFSVLIPAVLTDEQMSVITEVLRVHRPAHTVFDVCPIGSGMRIGRGLHVGLSSIVGRTAEFTSVQLGTWRLGRDQVVGRPEPGIRPGASRLGTDSRVG
jgi:phage tail-like protein